MLEHCKDSALEIIDARGALHAFYHWPKSLANHLAARLLLRWKWIYLVKYRFWYLILPEEDDPNKVYEMLHIKLIHCCLLEV